MTGQAQMFDDLRADLGRLADLPERQRAQAEELERSLRGTVNTAMGNARTTKDSAAEARRRLDALVGRIDRLAARAQPGAVETDRPGPPSVPTRVTDFGRAVDAAQREVTSAETAWEWVERTRTSLARRVATPVAPPPSAAPPPNQPASAPRRLNRAVVVAVTVAALVLIGAIVLIVR